MGAYRNCEVCGESYLTSCPNKDELTHRLDVIINERDELRARVKELEYERQGVEGVLKLCCEVGELPELVSARVKELEEALRELRGMYVETVNGEWSPEEGWEWKCGLLDDVNRLLGLSPSVEPEP